MADAGLASLRHVEHEIEREVSLLTVRGQAAFSLEGHGSPILMANFLFAPESDCVSPAAICWMTLKSLSSSFPGCKVGRWVGRS